jgi:hypothetical protein
MTPDELRAIPTVLGLSRAHLARLLSRSPRCISHWTLGDRPLPYEVGILLQLLAAQKITVRDVEEAAAPSRTNGSAAPDPQPAIADSEFEPRVSARTVDSEPARLKSAMLPAVPGLTTAQKVYALGSGCRWPYSDPQCADFHFCNKPVVTATTSYCAQHYARAHIAQPLPKTRPGPSVALAGALAPAGAHECPSRSSRVCRS